MRFDRKVLWTVSMNTAAEEARLLAHAQAAGCNAVAIRTTSKRLPAAIGRFHAEGIKVFAWRWPARRPRVAPLANYYAPEQAAYVVDALIPAGLDGYFADIESDHDGGANDWNAEPYEGLKPLAREFCTVIRAGALNAGKRDFEFALTSGVRQPAENHHIPWAEFVDASDYLLPQTYWRWTNPSTNKPQDINGGAPPSAIAAGQAAWGPAARGKPIIPMAGELDLVTPEELASFATRIAALGVRQLHLYADTGAVSPAVLAAAKAL